LLLLQAGSKVVCVADGLPTWVCELIVAKPAVQEAIAFMQQIEQELDIPVDPLPATIGCSKHNGQSLPGPGSLAVPWQQD
jgi:hypothetical protein